MNQKNTQQNTVLELWELLLRYRWRFVLPAFTIILCVLTISLFLPRKYRSEAMFERRTDLVLTEMTAKGATGNFQDPRNSLIEEISGSRAADELIQQIQPQLAAKGMLHTELDRQTLRADLIRHTIVHWDIASGALDRVRVEYISADSEVSQMVVNGLVENYIRRSRKVMEKRLNESALFFREEVANNREIIDDLETKLLAFEIDNGELLPESANGVQERLGARATELQDMIARHDASIVRVRNLRQAISETPATVPEIITAPNPELIRLNDKLRQINEKITQYTEVLKMRAAHPDLIALSQRVASLQDTIDKTDKTIVAQELLKANPKLAELELQLTRTEGEEEAFLRQIEVIGEQVDQMASQTDSMFPVRSDYRKLNRQVDQAQRQLTFWEDNLRRIDMALAAETGNRGIQLDFVRHGEIGAKPVSPNFSQVFMAAIGLGLMSGALSVFFAHRTDESFASGDDLAQAFNLQLLGSVSELISRQHRKMRRIRNMILYPTNFLAMTAALIAMASLLYLDLEKPQTLAEVKAKASWIFQLPSAEASGVSPEPPEPSE